jgi:hypothetical protein
MQWAESTSSDSDGDNSAYAVDGYAPRFEPPPPLRQPKRSALRRNAPPASEGLRRGVSWAPDVSGERPAGGPSVSAGGAAPAAVAAAAVAAKEEAEAALRHTTADILHEQPAAWRRRRKEGAALEVVPEVVALLEKLEPLLQAQAQPQPQQAQQQQQMPASPQATPNQQ